MANIFKIDRASNKIILGTTGTTINIASHTASRLLALDASKDLTVKAIGTDVQAWDASLDSIAGLTYASDSFIKVTAEDTYAIRTLSEVRTDLGLVIGTNVQAQGGVLDDLNTLGANVADSEFLVGTGAGALAWESGATARTSIGLGITDTPQFTTIKMYNAAVDTTTPYLGIYNTHVKTAGVTDYNDIFWGINNYIGYNQSGGVLSHSYAFDNTFVLINGDIGDGSNSRNLYGIYDFVDLDGGKIYGNVYGSNTNIDQEAANEVTGSIYGHYIDIDADGTVGGSVVGLYLLEGSNVDYGIFQNGTADNYLGGKLGIGVYPKTKLTVEGTITLKEQAAANGDTAAYGQIWVKSDAPNVLMFTDDTGADFTVDVTAV